MTTILVSDLLRSNLEWMRILRLMLQTPIADHHSSRDKELDREDGSQLLVVQCKNDAIVIRGFHDIHLAETRNPEGKLDTLVNLVTASSPIISPPLLQEFAASVLPMTTILVSVLLRSNLEWMSILRFLLQTPIVYHHSSRD
ncbi:hypothetical protein Fmac_028569 [Flemingia macrophylla]|uniref:Uncharacterized protein n=1 Tax=Flemingia macrophylla TaxID=520843 RepID=A0ABD1L7V9_9FABA